MIRVVLTILLTAPVAVGQAEADRLFEVGSRLVAEGDTAGAVAAWEGATATGWTSAAVEHDLGTVALARGETARARLHLERAARLAPRTPAVVKNVRLARARAGEPEPSAARRAWEQSVATLRPLGLVALALALSFGAFALALRGRRRAALVLGGVALLAVGAASVAVWERTRPLAVVMAEAAVVESPSPSAAGVARLAPGETVSAGDAVEGWRPVRAGRLRGWVRADAVEPI